ncbi:CBO0543 family protein [Mesobacillus subterraneus]|uniref:CBO0543 family protein n=1 Tax=Mesobacillus subterraneus TaxID=285983 RepID=UPI001CFF36BA|nr:CBO0543 family protein [Mesobacillus subterraneus]
MTYPTQEEINKVHTQLVEMRYENFIHQDLFSFQWWFLLSLFVLPWILWWLLVDKNRIKDIWLFGSLISILIITLDDLGIELNLWYYPYQVLNIIPRLNPIDISVLPVFHMLVYQYFTKWKSFIIANILTAFLYAYLAEPLFVKINIYVLTNWDYIYSVPIYIGKAVLIKFILEGVLLKSKGA